MNTVTPDIPSEHIELRDDPRHPHWVILTAYRIDSQDPVTVEIPYDQWIFLPPIQYVIKLELSRQQPRRPAAVSNTPGETLPVPRGHVEWKDGQNWVVLTACRIGTQEAVTVEMTLGQLFTLRLMRLDVREQLECWHDRKRPVW
jgi:hypothetical protein